MVEPATSQSRNVFLYVCVCFYLLTLVVVAVIAHQRKKRTAAAEGELQAHFGGAFGPGLLALTTFSTVYSGFTVTGIPQEAYRRGFISLRWIGATLAIVLGMLLVYPRLRRLSVTRGYKSPNDFVTDRYRSGRLRFLCAVCGYVPLLIYLSAQMIAFAAMVRGFTLQSIPDWASLAAFCVIILALEKLGGMNSVVMTDAAQSLIMILVFLAVPFVLWSDFGSLPSIGPPNCDSLTFAMPSAGGPDEPPSSCITQEPIAAKAAGCIAAGCAGTVRPSFFEYPSRTDQADICFFLVNMLAAPLQPHMVQRAYIARSDGALRIVMAVMLLAPFLAQPPGIIMGITKAAFEPSWPETSQKATAFAAVSDELAGNGTFQYVLVTVMACSTLAAIMSTADSVLMGASSLVSIDIYKGLFNPSASTKRVVFVGEMNSLIMAAAGFVVASCLTVGQLGNMILFQNGMLMQLVPAYGLGLFTNVSERPVVGGVAAGLLVLVVLALTGNPLDPYVPLVNVSVSANFAVTAVLQVFAPGNDEKKGPVADAARAQFGERLASGSIKSVMANSREPSRPLLGLMLALLLLAVPWYGEPGTAVTSVFGVPRWGVVQVALFVAAFLLGLVAIARWRVPEAGAKVADVGGEAQETMPLRTSKKNIQEVSAYTLFVQEARHKASLGSPAATGEQLLDRWNRLPSHEKQVFMDRAEAMEQPREMTTSTDSKDSEDSESSEDSENSTCWGSWCKRDSS